VACDLPNGSLTVARGRHRTCPAAPRSRSRPLRVRDGKPRPYRRDRDRGMLASPRAHPPHHHSVRTFWRIAHNPRARAICDRAWTRRASPAALFLRIRRILSGREIDRSIGKASGMRTICPTRAACGSGNHSFAMRSSPHEGFSCATLRIRSLELRRNRRSASLTLPTPVNLEAQAVPTDEGFRRHDGQSAAPIETAAEPQQSQAR
jgi:hypothetical protein